MEELEATEYARDFSQDQSHYYKRKMSRNERWSGDFGSSPSESRRGEYPSKGLNTFPFQPLHGCRKHPEASDIFSSPRGQNAPS